MVMRLADFLDLIRWKLPPVWLAAFVAIRSMGEFLKPVFLYKYR